MDLRRARATRPDWTTKLTGFLGAFEQRTGGRQGRAAERTYQCIPVNVGRGAEMALRPATASARRIAGAMEPGLGQREPTYGLFAG